MSEEMNQEKKCYKKLLIGGVIDSLILSIAAMTQFVVAFLGVNEHIPSLSAKAEMPISKK